MYTITLDPVAEHQRDKLPVEARPHYEELLRMLELAPWGGDPYDSEKPDRNMRQQPFGGAGMATYFVMEERRLVYIVRITWL